MPENWLREFTVIVDVVDDPALMMIGLGGEAVIEKSGVVGRVKLVVTGLPNPVARSYPMLAEYPLDPTVMSGKNEE